MNGALVGCGFFARHHLHAWRMLEGADVVAVCDLDEARAEAYAREFGVPRFYSDVETMLGQEDLDFVDVATQANTHRTLVERVAGRGLNVICQKPLAPSLGEAKNIVAAARDVTLMVHENFRWQRPMLELKRASADIGSLFYGRISFRSAFDVYKDQPYLATDERFVLYDLGVHLFDLARFFFGEADALLCHTSRVNPNIRGEDVATALLKMQSGAHVVAEMSYASRLEQEHFPQTLVALEGDRGSAVLSADYHITLTTPRGTRHIDASPRPLWTPAPANAIPESVLNIQRHWLECLATGATPDTSGEDNLKTLELTFGAYASANEGKVVKPGRRVSEGRYAARSTLCAGVNLLPRVGQVGPQDNVTSNLVSEPYV